PPESLSVVRPEVPEPLCHVVEQMMAKRPEDRYQTPAEVVTALQFAGRRSVESAIEESPPAELSSRPQLSLGRRWGIRFHLSRSGCSLTLAVMATFLVAVVGGGFLVNHYWDQSAQNTPDASQTGMHGSGKAGPDEVPIVGAIPQAIQNAQPLDPE